MRALVKTTAGPGLELIDVPEPACGDRDVKIRVLRAGLCGTDLHLLSWDDWAAATVQAPMTIGHEFFGEVVEVGADVDHVSVGDRVSGEGHIVCGACRNCRAGRRQLCINTVGVGVNRDGAFADYVVIPAANAWVQPADLDPDLGALFDPLGNATHTALQWPVVGEDVVITGAGPIGIMATAIVRHAGARRIAVTDLSPERLELAASAGADLTVDVSQGQDLAWAQRQLGMLEGFDIGLEMSGAPDAVRDMLENLNHGARVAMLGLPRSAYEIDWGKVITHMITLRGIYGREMFETWYLMGSMLATTPALRDAVQSVITWRGPAEDWEEAFEHTRSGTAGKAVLDWS
ncbi:MULTISPECIES: L-threonine 3-dehydrogenase [unclassified Nocardioides]|uniref:L-threonine 3-dehydrogenase n=1 Tax=unclassified Nocardioides TaxID=2615069 RepID=UPI0000571156|nr:MULTISPECIES: L-threonine 3-dehydrogenase [unclassified Nocardioides]ABL83257.1 L-threonine 3-dehydrogenase [Nocardioides sp. JS614]